MLHEMKGGKTKRETLKREKVTSRVRVKLQKFRNVSSARSLAGLIKCP